MQTFVLPRNIINDLMSHAQEAPENEICGLIGQSATGFHSYRIENIASDTRFLYTMEPHAQIDAMRTMRENDEELVAIYHSHPSSPAYPSVTDLEEATYPDVVYLIISLNTKGVLEMSGFQLKDHEITTLEVIMQGL